MSTITVHPECGGGTVTVLGLARCPGSKCGHRQTVNGIPPVETRRQPWRAGSELLGRHLARKAGAL